MTRIPCISVRQPWATLIASGVKDVENRSWCPDYRGPLLIHASSGIDKDALRRLVSDPDVIASPVHVCDMDIRSAIVGLVDLYDIVGDSTSRWAVDGAYHWLLRGARTLPQPIHGHGKLRLWYPPKPTVKEALRQLGLPVQIDQHDDGSATVWY